MVTTRSRRRLARSPSPSLSPSARLSPSLSPSARLSPSPAPRSRRSGARLTNMPPEVLARIVGSLSVRGAARLQSASRSLRDGVARGMDSHAQRRLTQLLNAGSPLQTQILHMLLHLESTHLHPGAPLGPTLQPEWGYIVQTPPEVPDWEQDHTHRINAMFWVRHHPLAPDEPDDNEQVIPLQYVCEQPGATGRLRKTLYVHDFSDATFPGFRRELLLAASLAARQVGARASLFKTDGTKIRLDPFGNAFWPTHA